MIQTSFSDTPVFFSPPPSFTVLEMKGVKFGSRIPKQQSKDGEQSKARESVRNSAKPQSLPGG